MLLQPAIHRHRGCRADIDGAGRAELFNSHYLVCRLRHFLGNTRTLLTKH